MTAHVNGIDLFYEVTGSGRPLILVHGNGEDHTIFDEAVAVLRESFTCYGADSRGHGRSTPLAELAGGLHYTDMARDIVCLLEQLDLRNAVFYGFSDGGIVGLLAAGQTDRITDLIVSGANLTPRGVKAGLRLRFRLSYLWKKDPLTRLMLQEPRITDADLAKITARTLVLAGDGDLIREAETRRIAAGIPGAQLRILPGEDHGSYIVHSPKIGEILRDYLLGQEDR